MLPTTKPIADFHRLDIIHAGRTQGKTALTNVSAVLLTGNYLSSQAVSNQVLSAYVGLTTVFGMGTGGSPQLSPPDCEKDCSFKTA